MFVLGDAICRRIFNFISIPHRFAVACLSGLLISTWITYVTALLCVGSTQPLFWGNLVFAACAIGAILLLNKWQVPEQTYNSGDDRYVEAAPESDELESNTEAVEFESTSPTHFEASEEPLADSNDPQSDSESPVNFDPPSHSGEPPTDDGPLIDDEPVSDTEMSRADEASSIDTNELDHLTEEYEAGEADTDDDPVPEEPTAHRSRDLKKDSDQHIERIISREDPKWDWGIIGIYFAFVSFLMLVTLGGQGNQIRFTSRHWSDFGPNTGIMQNFIFGHNFPPENPHFGGELVRHHFLFWFETANLEYLGLTPDQSINILSILTMVAMLILAMTLFQVLFRSRVVARIGAALFFCSGSLAYITYFRNQASWSAALQGIPGLRLFIDSGFPYPGETWGIWTIDVFLQQRHFASGIGLLLIVMVFLADFYKRRSTKGHKLVGRESWFKVDLRDKRVVKPFLFCGILLGLLPLWNSAVFASAVVILACWLVLFSPRRYMIYMAIASAIISLPQYIYMSGGGAANSGFPKVRLGYVVIEPTIYKVIEFMAFSSGFKWVAIAIALIVSGWFHRRVFIAISSIILVGYTIQFSPELVANHKFTNIWLVFVNGFVAYGLWRLWHLKGPIGVKVIARAAAALLTVGIALGGILDLFPIWNEGTMHAVYKDDPLITWVRAETDPAAVFLTDKYVSHPILLAGRRLFYGHPLYAFSAGHDTYKRDRLYDQMFQERDPAILQELLVSNNISYVAIDDGLRARFRAPKTFNEDVYRETFKKVYGDDVDKKYGALVIFEIPKGTVDGSSSAVPSNFDRSSPPVSAFVGGQGNGRGQFLDPRGITVDQAGNMYIADTGNARIQKFSPEGTFMAAFGSATDSEGQLREPNGVAVDDEGNIYVADALTHKILKLAADGSFVKAWTGFDPGFFGPRDIKIVDKKLFFIDQGNCRVVTIDLADDRISAWGKQGGAEGEFLQPTGIDVAADRVYVADGGNNRVQVFDLTGKFIAVWPIPEWASYPWQYPDVAVDTLAGKVYVTSPLSKEILVFDLNGTRAEPIRPGDPGALMNASNMVISRTKTNDRLLVLNTGGANVKSFDIPSAKKQK